MERGTAEVLKECLQRNAAVSPWTQAFRWRCRASCTDKAGYNLKADSSIARDRGTQWAALHTDCEVHWQCTSTCFQKTYVIGAYSQIKSQGSFAVPVLEPSIGTTDFPHLPQRGDPPKVGHQTRGTTH